MRRHRYWAEPDGGERLPVGRRMHHLRDADRSAGAGNVDDDDGILDERGRLLGEHAKEPVRAAARCGGDDELDRLRERGGCCRQQERGDNESHGDVSSVLL